MVWYGTDSGVWVWEDPAAMGARPGRWALLKVYFPAAANRAASADSSRIFAMRRSTIA
jgi:hypothetical protein